MGKDVRIENEPTAAEIAASPVVRRNRRHKPLSPNRRAVRPISIKEQKVLDYLIAHPDEPKLNAAKAGGYKCVGMVYNLLKRGPVIRERQRRQKKVSHLADINAEKVMADIERVRAKAEGIGDSKGCDVAIKGSALQAKIIGMLDDKSNVNVNVGGTLVQVVLDKTPHKPLNPELIPEETVSGADTVKMT